MSIKKYIIQQFSIHKYMMPEDVVKLCYQAAMGAEHLLTDSSRARSYFEAEIREVEARECPLYEKISDDVARIDLGAWKARGLSGEWLFNMFYASACPRIDGRARLAVLLSEAEEALREVKKRAFSDQEWEIFVKNYISEGMSAIHHSAFYRKYEKPSYRIVDAKFLNIIPILEELSRQNLNIAVVSIDGRAASGKSTVADLLVAATDASVVRMDDFFLPPSLRSEERLTEAGGNIHYERFISEILPALPSGDPFEYGIFDCSKMAIASKRFVKGGDIRVVEGSYSHQPQFGDYADIKVFVTVSPETQKERILSRNGEKFAKMFEEKWIPMEEKYFDAFSVKENSHIVITTE